MARAIGFPAGHVMQRKDKSEWVLGLVIIMCILVLTKPEPTILILYDAAADPGFRNRGGADGKFENRGCADCNFLILFLLTCMFNM